MIIIPGTLTENFQNYREKKWEPLDISDGFRPQFQEVSKSLNQAARAIAYVLMGSSNTLIWQTSDRMGNTWWIVDVNLIMSEINSATLTFVPLN